MKTPITLSQYQPKGTPLASPDRWWAHELTHRVGITLAARAVGVSRATLASAIAGLPVYAGTAALVRAARLRNRDAA